MITLLKGLPEEKGDDHTVTDHVGTEGGVEVQLCWFWSWDLDGGGWSTPRSDCLTPGKRTSLPIVEEVGWVPGSVRTGVKEISSNMSWFFHGILMKVYVDQLCYIFHLDINKSNVCAHTFECVLWRYNVTSSVLLCMNLIFSN